MELMVTIFLYLWEESRSGSDTPLGMNIKQSLVSPVRSETDRKPTADIKLGFGLVSDGFGSVLGRFWVGSRRFQSVEVLFTFCLLFSSTSFQLTETVRNRSKTEPKLGKTGKVGSKSPACSTFRTDFVFVLFFKSGWDLSVLQSVSDRTGDTKRCFTL